MRAYLIVGRPESPGRQYAVGVYIDKKKHKHDKRKRRLERQQLEARRIASERPADHCPRCWYDLSGLTGQPCPECGMGQAERTGIYAEFDREHSANILGLRGCYELWRPVGLLTVVAAIISQTWASVGVALVGVSLLVLAGVISNRAQNPLDTLEEMNRFSVLRIRRRLWSAVSFVLLTIVIIASLLLLAIRFVG